MIGQKKIRTILNFLLCGSLICGVLPFLTSCSTAVPTFSVSNAKKDWVKNTKVDITAMWKGYYFNDVNDPYQINDVYIPPEHQSDIHVDVANTGKHKDDVGQTQYANVSFIIDTDAPDSDTAKPFTVTITWTIAHTSFKKISTIVVTPPVNGIINIDQDFKYVSAPDTTYDMDPSTLTLNSLQCIDNVYKSDQSDTQTRAKIETHLTNDFIWLELLMFQSLHYVWIDDSLGAYSEIDNSASWIFHVELSYDYINNQVFKYIKISCTADATVHIIIPSKATLNFNYQWGAAPDDKNDLPWDGPRLLGAFTPSQELPTTPGTSNDGRAHFPQGYVPKSDSTYKPYDQNFLQLVPSSPNSYATYRLNINSPIKNFTSGTHIYFFSQPRFMGLEFANGCQHIIIADPAKGNFNDSFGSWQLSLPSYTLSGMSYNTTDGFVQEYPEPNIQQCYTEINKHLGQRFQNSLFPGDQVQFANTITGFLLQRDINPNTDSTTDPAYINEAIQTNILQNKCVVGSDGPSAPWNNIAIRATENGPILASVPYYQIIQRASHGFPNSSSKGVPYNGNTLGGYESYSNIIYDPATQKFTRFSQGLNYMFYTDNMFTGPGPHDNTFTYTADDLQNLNDNFNNNPS